MSLTERMEVRTPCFAPCADCNCRPDLLDRPSIMEPSLKDLAYAQHKQTEWDQFFLGMAKYIAKKSKDPSTKSGSVIVRPDHSVASIGFNGFPKKMPDVITAYEKRDEKYSRMVHSEVNAAIFCRDESMEGYTLYNWPLPPCDRCVVEMIQHGITRFVAPKMSQDVETRWGESVARTRQYIYECGLELLEVDFE